MYSHFYHLILSNNFVSYNQVYYMVSFIENIGSIPLKFFYSVHDGHIHFIIKFDVLMSQNQANSVFSCLKVRDDVNIKSLAPIVNFDFIRLYDYLSREDKVHFSSFTNYQLWLNGVLL